MNEELLSDSILIGSAIVKSHPGIVPKLAIHKDYKKNILPAADRLLKDGIMVHAEPNGMYDIGFDPDLCITTFPIPWRITEKGEYLLATIYENRSNVEKQRSMINLFLNLNTGTGDVVKSSAKTPYNVATFKREILKQIDDSIADEEKKDEAKIEFEKMLEQPLLNAALGVVLGQ